MVDRSKFRFWQNSQFTVIKIKKDINKKSKECLSHFSKNKSKVARKTDIKGYKNK